VSVSLDRVAVPMEEPREHPPGRPRKGGAKAADLENVSNGLLRIFHLRALGLGDRWDSAITSTLDRLRLPVRAAA